MAHSREFGRSPSSSRLSGNTEIISPSRKGCRTLGEFIHHVCHPSPGPFLGKIYNTLKKTKFANPTPLSKLGSFYHSLESHESNILLGKNNRRLFARCDSVFNREYFWRLTTTCDWCLWVQANNFSEKGDAKNEREDRELVYPLYIYNTSLK